MWYRSRENGGPCILWIVMYVYRDHPENAGWILAKMKFFPLLYFWNRNICWMIYFLCALESLQLVDDVSTKIFCLTPSDTRDRNLQSWKKMKFLKFFRFFDFFQISRLFSTFSDFFQLFHFFSIFFFKFLTFSIFILFFHFPKKHFSSKFFEFEKKLDH